MCHILVTKENVLGHLMRVFIPLDALEFCECPGKERWKKEDDIKMTQKEKREVI